MNMFMVNRQKAFALPTVLIASVVMLTVLTVTLTSVSASRSALESQYYQRLAREAAESGLAKAQACLATNNYEPQWSNASPLRPQTNCLGATDSGASAYVLNTSGIRTYYEVSGPEAVANGVQRVNVTATVEQLRTSTATPWRTYNVQTFATVSGQVSFNQVAFGYNINGAFFGTIDAQGKALTLGYNGNGQLGTGSTANSLTPQTFILPANVRAQSLFTNFLSVGYTMFATTTDGRLYGAGLNSSGQLGNGTVSTTQSTPVQFSLPAGVQARYVSVLTDNTFVIGSDNNIYASGACVNGKLGSNYTLSGCSNRSTYVRVALPTVNTSNPATLPVATSDWVQSTNFPADRETLYIRMQGGQVYGWGANDAGQLGQGTVTQGTSVPVKIGTWGDSGKPKAVQLAFEGTTAYVLDSNGDVFAFGYTSNGAVAGARAPLRSSTGLCVDNPGNSTTNGARLQLWTCNNSDAQKIEWTYDNRGKFRPNTSQEFCIDNANNSSANGNPIQIYQCLNNSPQQWVFRSDGSIYNPPTGKCLDNPGNSATTGTQLQLYDCNGSAAQVWTPQPLVVPEKVPIPASSGKVLRITTDQWATFFLTEDGKIWGAGANDRGQLGNGTVADQSFKLTQFILPGGRTAVDLYTTKAGPLGSEYANTYAILDDGSVYGAGTNSFGQLGNGTTSTYRSTPVKMSLPAGTRAKSVQSGMGTTVIITDKGGILTVGNNANGQLGDGTTTNSSIPRANKYTNIVPTRFY